MEGPLAHSCEWQKEPERRRKYLIDLNRHCLLPGMLTQDTRMTTLRCFLLLEVVATLLPDLWARRRAT